MLKMLVQLETPSLIIARLNPVEYKGVKLFFAMKEKSDEIEKIFNSIMSKKSDIEKLSQQKIGGNSKYFKVRIIGIKFLPNGESLDADVIYYLGPNTYVMKFIIKNGLPNNQIIMMTS